MKLEWMKAMMLLDENVNALVDETGDNNSNNYQMKVNFWKSVTRRRFLGSVTHLKSKRSTRFDIDIPGI